MPDIVLENLSFSYKDGRKNRTALDGLQLQIHDGEFLCLIGASGCGKSTLLRLLAGLEKPDGGRILLNSQEIRGPGADRMIVFQDYALFPWMSAEKNISFSVRQARHLSGHEANQIAREYLSRVGMENEGELYPFQLSGGMRQRVAIARALAMDTDILLLDEPFGALDAKIRRQLQDLLIELWFNGGKRKTVVFVTHDINEAILLADRVVFMRPGQIVNELSVDLPRPRIDNGLFARYRDTMLAWFDSEKEETAHEA